MSIKRIIGIVVVFVFLSSIQHFIYKYKYKCGGKEGMENGNEKKIRNVYLLGDSIIKNDSYVTRGRSVEYHINTMLKSNKKGDGVNVINLAIDNSCINDIYEQLRYIPENSKDGMIFLSVGGNDILKKYVYIYNTDFIGLPNLFKKYKDLVERIKTQYPQHKLVLMNIYYPPNKQIFSPFYPLITEWNKCLLSVSDDISVSDIIHIDEIMTETDDFVDNIEPSEKGGEKIANLITTHIL